MTAQVRKKPYGVTTITTSAGSKLAPAPSELALKYKLDIPIRRNGDFSLELKEYRQGVYVKDLLDDKIIGGKVNEGDRMEFVQFLDFKGGKEFQLLLMSVPPCGIKRRIRKRSLIMYSMKEIQTLAHRSPVHFS